MRRRAETIKMAQAIHGGSEVDIAPIAYGLVDVLASKIPAGEFSELILSRPKLKNAIKKDLRVKKNTYYNSNENMERSVAMYYSYVVLGKRKYIRMCRSNRKSDGSNMVHYPRLAAYIRSINIGTLNDINDFAIGNEYAIGVYRDLKEHALRLAEFYVRVDKEREDKLEFFPNVLKRDPDSKMFIMAIGGDGAPVVGTVFLISFVNVIKRIASSAETFLIMGTNEKEESVFVSRYVKHLADDIRFLEGQVFERIVDGFTLF